MESQWKEHNILQKSDKESKTVGSANGFQFLRSRIGRTGLLVLAPMVEQSELAWRMLSRRYGAELCYTPMLHASTFVKDHTYRKENLVTCAEDKPLIAQFCANNAETFVKAAQLAAPYCDGVDLNLGCPQTIARRGFYGAFLQDDWDRIYKIIVAACEQVNVPISCKIRVFKEIDKTVCYAKMIERAGCKLLAVHGRTREQKGPDTGLASWEHIAAVKRNVSIPVFANGNIQLHEDIEKCYAFTGVDGVMIAEGGLHNPALFTGHYYPSWKMALEYLDLVDTYPCPLSCVRAHFFKLFHYSLNYFPDLRAWLAKAGSMAEFRDICETFKERTQEEHEKYKFDPADYDCAGLLFPHWICQPYYRPGVGEGRSSESEVAQCLREERRKRHHEELNAKSTETGLSKRRLRKMARYPKKTFPVQEQQREHRSQYAKCHCGNPRGNRCEFRMCRRCCKNSSFKDSVNCAGHSFWFGTIAERNKLLEPVLQERPLIVDNV